MTEQKKKEKVMNAIEYLDNQITTRTQASNRAVLSAYMATQESGNELLDFSGVIFDTDIPAIITELKELGISEFTVSVRQTDMAATLWGLSQHGATLTGLVEVKSNSIDWATGERQMVPAFHLTIN